jgi:hypothetical protein
MNTSVLVQSEMIRRQETIYRQLKRGIWFYFILLIFEGALRKWFLSGLASPLLIIRDPVALWLLLKARQVGLFKINGYILTLGIVGVIAFFTAMLFGHGNLYVALFGVRILLLHFPLMFVIGEVFSYDDVLNIGRATLIIAIPMIILIGLQFGSPQSAWVNRGVGGDLNGAGFAGALGFLRPPGTFSFTNGNALFWCFTVPFVVYFWLVPQNIIKPWVLVAATTALLAAVPLSISRSLLFQIGLTLIFVFTFLARKPKVLGKFLAAFSGILILLLILNQTSIFQTGTEAFTSRFTAANESEGGLQGVFLDRFLGGMISAITNSSDLPFFGYGIGMGTNVGSQILTGSLTFLISEGEWGRLIGEMGLLLGLIVIVARINLVIEMTKLSFRQIGIGNILPWMLLSFGFIDILQTQWSQPTSLGFCIVSGGLILASLKGDSGMMS